MRMHYYDYTDSVGVMVGVGRGRKKANVINDQAASVINRQIVDSLQAATL